MNHLSMLLVALPVALFCPADSQTGGCVQRSSIGDVSICFPELSNKTLCGSKCNSFQTMRGNTALAYYISNEQISKEFSSILLNNYFKVWKIDAMNSHHFTSNDLTNYQDQLTRGITFKEWAQVKNNVKQYMKTNLSIGQPMGVEKFKPATNAITMVQIYHFKDESGTDKYGLIIQTICSIRNRMVVVDHHLIYDGEETIAYGKRETRSFIEKLNERNG